MFLCLDRSSQLAPASLAKNTPSRNAPISTVHRLGAARFEYDPHDTQRAWHITTTDQRVDLYFTPQGKRAAHINVAGLIRSDFHQSFGTFAGQIVGDTGFVHTTNGAFGVTEHHILKT